jgi:hypothetical protein
MTTRCMWEGCTATTAHPEIDGWTYLLDWGHGIKDGIYCPTHAAAIEKVRSEGGLDDPENDAAPVS